MHDVNILDEIVPEAGSFYVMDRGYLTLSASMPSHTSGALFVFRSKSGVLLKGRSEPNPDAVIKTTPRVLYREAIH